MSTDLADLPPYRGEFEVHLTVETRSAAALERFRVWCAEQGFKCVHIVLSRGDHAEQPMATWRRGITTLPPVRAPARYCAASPPDPWHIGNPDQPTHSRFMHPTLRAIRRVGIAREGK